MQCFDNFVQCYIRISNVVDKITIQAGCVSTFIIKFVRVIIWIVSSVNVNIKWILLAPFSFSFF